MARQLAVLSLAGVALLHGACMITSAGHGLEPIAPPRPRAPGAIEQTVGDFRFRLEGGALVTANKAGRILNDQILNRWIEQGYIQSHRYVPSGEFSPHSRYRLTLGGSQYGESNVALQVLSGLTFYLVPHFIDTKYDVVYTLEDAATNRTYTARVADGYATTWQLFLLLALPVSGRGAIETWDNMADHLYEQLRSQGAFGPDPPLATAGAR